MNRTTLAFALVCLPGIALAQNLHIVHCLAGCPTGTPDTNDLVVREIYALSNNQETRFADWVAYRVTRETIGTSDSLDRAWGTTICSTPTTPSKTTTTTGPSGRYTRTGATRRRWRVSRARASGGSPTSFPTSPRRRAR